MDAVAETQNDSPSSNPQSKIDEKPIEEEDIVLIRNNPNSNRKAINKSAYAKLQRSFHEKKSIDIVKEKFETKSKPEVPKKPATLLRRSGAFKLQNVDDLKSKSPKIAIDKPTPSPRVRSEIFLTKRLPSQRFSIPNSTKDENSNELYEDGSVESIPIILRQKSIDSINWESQLDDFVMDKTKEKRRSNSIKKIFSGGLFGSRKKNKDEAKIKNDSGVVYSDNMNNDNIFSRQSPHRHTIIGGSTTQKTKDYITRAEEDYAKMHVNKFKQVKENFEKVPEEYVDMDKPLPKAPTYMNMPYVSKYIDTSSSSTLDKPNNYENDSNFINNSLNRRTLNRDTPPRLEETRQDVKVVNPKALPNGHPALEETYGTVFDCVDSLRHRSRLLDQKPPKSPSLEATKLKLPQNRDIIELAPRMKSPIPQDQVSTDRIIATELLKNRSPVPGKKTLQPSHTNLEIQIDYPDGSLKRSNQLQTNAMVHTPSPLHNRSLSPMTSTHSIRSSTPVDMRRSTSSLKSSPQKEEIRKNVEEYYWKEIKKQKEQDDIYMHHVMNGGYGEDPVVRRSRSMSPTTYRSRRALSLPRSNTGMLPPSPFPQNVQYVQGASGNTYIIEQRAMLPEGRAMVNQINPRYSLRMPPSFVRSSPERRTIEVPNYENYNNSLYRPIFKRGSLTQQAQLDQQINKKVSFSQKESPQAAWPTKNGFTKSPPQRRISDQKDSILEDDVFLPPGQEIYGYANAVPYQSNRENLYMNKREVYYRPEVEYVPRPNMYVVQPREASRMRVEDMYGQPIDYVRQNNYGLTRHGSITINEPIYGERRRISLDAQARPTRRELIVNDNEIFGQIGGYAPTPSPIQRHSTNRNLYLNQTAVGNPMYASRQSVMAEPIYGAKQVSVRNKVCDMYGQIHEGENGSYGQQGVVMGRLNQSPRMAQKQFVRGSRLTASANDMHRRMQNPDPRYHSDTVYQLQQQPPTRPLPPVPASPRMTPIQSKSKKRSIFEEEWNADGKGSRGTSGNDSGRSDNEGEVRGRGRNTRRDDPRRHTLGADQQYLTMAGQGGPLARTMDLESYFTKTGQPRGYPPPSNAMLFDDDPGIMSEVETSSTGFRRGGKQRSSLPVVRTPSKTLERPLGLVFLQYRNETKRALLPNEITSIDTVKALFVRSFPKQLTMEYLDSPNVKIYIHDSSKDMFYELEDLRSHLREIRDRSVLRLFESADVSGGLPMAGIGIAGGVGHFEDPSYFSEPEFDSEYQHQHIHKSKGSTGKGAPYYMGSTASLPRGTTLLRTYAPAVGNLPADRLKSLPSGAPPKPQRAYSSGAPRSNEGPARPTDRFAPFQRPANPLFNVPDGYMSSPERGSRYEDPYYSQYGTRSGSITPVIDEEVSDTELLEDSYSLYGVKLPSGGPRSTPRSPFAPPAAVPYDATRLRVENMERQLANLTGLVQKALTITPTTHLQVPGRDNYRAGDEFDKNSSSSSASLPDDSYLRSDSNKAPKLGKSGCHKSVSFEKSVSFSDEPPDMNSPKQHSPQHAADTKPAKPAIKSSTLPRTSSQERDRLKPAPPPKPASLSPGQYDSRNIYRDLQLTPEMYNQLRGLQKKAKDLRAEMRNLRRMSQAQAHSVKETIRDTFIKIRAMLMAGGEQVWQAGMDEERVRLTREEDLYKQEMLRLETDLSDLESTVEELRGNVINRKTRVNMSDVENMALVLSKSSKTVADLKLRFPGLQDGMKTFLSTEMEKVMREEKFLKEEPERLESALRRCKKLTGTLVTLKRLASVQEQRLPCSNSSGDGNLSPTQTETPPITPTSSHSKPPTGPRMGSLVLGGDSANSSDSGQRPENALDALLDELQTFSKPHPIESSSEPPAIPAKGIAPLARPPQMSEIGRKGSMDSASFLPTQNLTVSTATGSLRRLHSYPSGSDTDNSPPIQPIHHQKEPTKGKPPIPERNTELLQNIASGKRIPPPPPPRTSSKSPLASPTSPSLPPRSPAAGLQHIQNVQNMIEKPQQSQFEQARENLGFATLRRNVPNRSSLKDKAQTLPRNIGSNLQLPNSSGDSSSDVVSVSNSSSCESVNSQDGSKKTRKEELEQRHQELLKKQKALQEQYARLQQIQRSNNTLAVIPPAPDQLLKKTGSESNLLQKMGLQMSTSKMTGSLTNIPSTTTANCISKTTLTNSNNSTAQSNDGGDDTTANTATTNKVYETDIL